jgi:glycosyltransferase involved in cell wall biosynthesis
VGKDKMQGSIDKNESRSIKVSVVMPSHNHGNFIMDALTSVLNQDFADYELVIIDDASKDNSVEIINKFIISHPELRIHFLVHEKNLGAVATLNKLIQLAEGKYIALINSDDVWLPNKLKLQVEILDHESNVGAVFTQAVITNEQLKVLGFADLPFADVFKKRNQTQGKWLRDFFINGNSLCHPSILIRKRVYEELGLYDPRLYQLPDFDYWIKLIKNYEIFVIPRILVKLRWHDNNTSKPSTQSINANNSEVFMIMKSFFDNMPDNIFIDGFADLFINPIAKDKQDLDCEKAFLLIKHQTYNNLVFHNLGLIALFNLLGEPTSERNLCKNYNFTYNELHNLLSQNQMFQGSKSETSDSSKISIHLKNLVRKIPFINRLAYRIWKVLREKYE